MPRNDDGSSAVQNLGFTLNFFGTNYTQFFREQQRESQLWVGH